MSKTLSNLAINKLELAVHLGVSEQERHTKQTVWVDLQIGFRKPPKACKTDALDNTFCYYELINHLKQTIGDGSFALLEHLGFSIHTILKKQLAKNTKLSVKVTKFPDIIDLREGVTFCYEDK